MGDLSKDFSRHEFACTCGCGFDTVDTTTLEILQWLRTETGKRVTITSACRCFAWNRVPISEGGPGSNDNSQHPRARAADIKVLGWTPKEVYDLLDKKYKDQISLGLYNTFVHIDTRTNGPARWKN